ncbi:hypothetical protein GCM10011369_24290 [Neiella marina]|uniref:Uncharacterized protein n=1 Tax=Neiella marina TaxID=508461 RepID=A0A8J2U6B5_9GAMM|nr:hypothetical protein GCM10011369_24290 [Neiella marina]
MSIKACMTTLGLLITTFVISFYPSSPASSNTIKLATTVNYSSEEVTQSCERWVESERPEVKRLHRFSCFYDNRS